MFGRKSKSTPPAVSDVFTGLRDRIFTMDPADVGLQPSWPGAQLWAAMLETRFPAAIVTLVCVGDGTTSMYFSNGGGVIGSGQHPQVHAASIEFLKIMQANVQTFTRTDDVSYPETGISVMRAMTFEGPFIASAREDDLGYKRHALWPVFHAAHDVMNQIRLIEQSRESQ